CDRVVDVQDWLQAKKVVSLGPVSPLLARQSMENACPAPDAFVEALEVELLIRRMDTIVVKREAYEQGIHPQHIFEVRHDRDRPSCAYCHRLVPAFFGEDPSRLGECRIIERKLDRRR